MRIDILTLFPAMLAGPLGDSMIGRAREAGMLDVKLWDARDFAADRHRIVDDAPYGGGTGMVMKIEPLAACLDHVLGDEVRNIPILVASPQGRLLGDAWARQLAENDRLVIVCGHYEGIDERLHALYTTQEFSIGDYVVTGGELPAMVLVDAVGRFVPGVLGDPESAATDCFADGLLKHPQYTRPEVFRGERVPEVLLSGHHERIRIWRRKESLRRTWQRRPDLLTGAQLAGEDSRLLAEALEETENDTATYR